MLSLIFTLGVLSPLGSLGLFLFIAQWRENRDRAVYLKRTGRIPF
jgi:hypothetical protein